MTSKEFLLKLEGLLQKCNPIYSSDSIEGYFVDDLKIIVTSSQNGFNIDVTKDEFIKYLELIPQDILNNSLEKFNIKFEDIIKNKNRDEFKKYLKSEIEDKINLYEDKVNSLKKLL